MTDDAAASPRLPRAAAFARRGAATVDAVVKVLLGNADKARALVKAVVPSIGAPRGLCPAGCDRALDHAIITAPDKRKPELMAKLDAVAGRMIRA